MHGKDFNYYSGFETKTFPDQKQLITYSFHENQHTITGVIIEKKDLFYLYEYRGAFVGNEFFISFSKESSSYKLISIEEMPGGSRNS